MMRSMGLMVMVAIMLLAGCQAQPEAALGQESSE